MTALKRHVLRQKETPQYDVEVLLRLPFGGSHAAVRARLRSDASRGLGSLIVSSPFRGAEMRYASSQV